MPSSKKPTEDMYFPSYHLPVNIYSEFPRKDYTALFLHYHH